jgi:hypothetical protein
MYDKVLKMLHLYDLKSTKSFVLDASTNKTDHHDITEILLKVSLHTIKQTNNMGMEGR